MKANFFPLTAALVTLSLVLFACQKEQVDEPVTVPPQQQIPNPLPEHARVKQLKWSDNDHQTMAYDDDGQLTWLRSQWQYVQNDPTQIRTVVYNFSYNDKGLPIEAEMTGGFTVKYFYNDTLIAKTQELYPGGAVAKEVDYLYANNRIVQENWKVSNLPNEPLSYYKHVFTYDDGGNLIMVAVHEKNDNQHYELLETTEYSNFDSKLNTTSWMLRYPYLPQVQWQFNNPRKEVWRPAQGMSQTTSHAYTYNQDGVPVRRQTIHPTGMITTMAYQY